MSILFDRSRVVQDWKCPRSRYWGYEYTGRGVRKGTSSLELFMGTVVHDCLATIATLYSLSKDIPIDEIADSAFKQLFNSLSEAAKGELGAEEFAQEQASLVEGMIRGFYIHMWPKLVAAYPKIVHIEKEVAYKYGEDLVFMAKPDLIMESEDGEWHYLEYKTTGWKNEEWINSWNTAVQLHSSVKAVEQSLGKAPVDVTIVGLYKGSKYKGKTSSVYCYAYKRNGNPPFTQDDLQYEWKAGYKKYPVWTMEGGVKKWVEEMPEEVLMSQFVSTPPIFVNESLVERFFAQAAEREAIIARTTFLLTKHGPIDDHEDVMDAVYPQRFDQCLPAFGRGCEFLKLCHGNVADPLAEGFSVREPHHQPEMDKFGD